MNAPRAKISVHVVSTEAARRRLEPSTGRWAEQLQFIGLDENLQYWTSSGAIAADAVKPNVIWITSDSHGTEQFDALARLGLESERPPDWIQTYNAGLDRPVYGALLDRGIRIIKSTAQAAPIADYVVGHAANLLLRIEEQRALQSAKDWQTVPFREISGTKWLLVGYGAIGREIAVRVKAFGAEIAALRRSHGEDDLVGRTSTLGELHKLLPEADVVVLACSLNDQTRDLADQRFFSLVKPNSILINVGRGALVVEEALRRALDEGRLGTAVLDVFRQEPLTPEAWQWTHPKVRVTAHTSNAGDGVVRRGDEAFIRNLEIYLHDRDATSH